MRSPFVLSTLLGALTFAACGGEQPLEDDQIAESAEALTNVVNIGFDGYTAGRLSSPWSVQHDQSDQSRAAIVATYDHGKALVLHGSTAAGAFVMGSLGLTSSSKEILAQFDVKPTAGSAFVFGFHGAGASTGARRIRLEMRPGSSTLVSNTMPNGDRACAQLQYNVWSRITLVVHTTSTPHTFDVRINSRSTSCTNLTAGIDKPFNAISVMDASNAGWGGDVFFDNFLVQTP